MISEQYMIELYREDRGPTGRLWPWSKVLTSSNILFWVFMDYCFQPVVSALWKVREKSPFLWIIASTELKLPRDYVAGEKLKLTDLLFGSNEGSSQVYKVVKSTVKRESETTTVQLWCCWDTFDLWSRLRTNTQKKRDIIKLIRNIAAIPYVIYMVDACSCLCVCSDF